MHILTLVKKKYQEPKSKVGDLVEMSKYKNIFAKVYVLNWSVEGFCYLKKLKLLCRGYI